MMKTKLVAMLMACLVVLYTSCSEKEVPQPVEDTERIDDLRAELRTLQIQVYGEEYEHSYLNAQNLDYKKDYDALKAEVDALKAAYDKVVSYTVVVVDYAGNAIAGAKVTLNQNGAVTTLDANAAGLVVFKNVRAGALGAVVKATGFATANYSTTLYSLDDGGATTTVPLLPKSGTQAESAMFTITGYLYANLNNANDTISGFNAFGGTLVGFDGPATTGPNAAMPYRSFDKQNKKVKATVSLSLGTVPYSTSWTSAPGAIRRMAFEDVIYEATVDATTSRYTLKLPSKAATIGQNFNLSYKLNFEEFSADKTFVDYDVNGTSNDGQTLNGFGLALGATPNSAFPKPATYTQKRIFRVPDRTFNSLSWGFTAEGALPGSTYAQDFYYSECNN